MGNRFKGCKLIVLSFLISFGVFYSVRFLENHIYQVFLMDHYLVFHTVVEYASIVMYLASFLVIYYVGDREKSLRMILTAGTLLFVGLIDFWHTFSYEGMPGLLVGSSAQLATTFWIIARLGFALGILGGSLIPIYRKVKTKKRFLLSAVPTLLSLFFLVYVSYFPQSFPALFVEGEGVTLFKQVLEYVIIIIMIAAFINLYREYRGDKRETLALFLSALIISIFSELSFTNYASVYDTYNLLGHVYKLIASYMIFKVMFIFNIKHPYDELDEAEKKISRYADNLEGLVEKRTKEVKEANKALIKDIEYAKTIQSAVMPVKHEKFDGLEVYSEYIPFEKIGGDYYGLEELDDEYIAFYLGDVAGHGIPAAMMTMFMRQTIVTHRRFQKEIREIYSPKDVIRSLYDRYNETDFPIEMYTVMIYGLYSKKDKKITFSSAGLNTHPIVYEEGMKAKTIEHSGFPICKYDKDYDPNYKNFKMQLKRGSKVIFYTDGTTEVKNKNGEIFGEDNLKKLLEEYGNNSPKEISEAIYREIEDFSRDIKLSDDVNYMIFEVK